MKICKTWLSPAWLRKKTHFEEKKALKNTFPQQKNTMMKKKHKKHFCFLKTLAGRTVTVPPYMQKYTCMCKPK